MQLKTKNVSDYLETNALSCSSFYYTFLCSIYELAMIYYSCKMYRALLTSMHLIVIPFTVLNLLGKLSILDNFFLHYMLLILFILAVNYK